MGIFLSQLIDPERQAECARHDAADAAFDARLHRCHYREPRPPEAQGRHDEASRRASCHALGLDPADPAGSFLRALRSPIVHFVATAAAACLGALVMWGAQL